MTDLLLVVGKGRAQSAISSLADSVEAQAQNLGVSVARIEQAGTVSSLTQQVAALVQEHSPTVVVPVGYTAAVTLAEYAWDCAFVPALPDVPGSDAGPFESVLEKLASLVRVSDYLITPDEGTRSILEYRVAGAGGRVLVPENLEPLRQLAQEALEVTPTRVLVSGHDLRFAADTLRFLQRTPNVEVRVQHWELAQAEPDETQRADVEWAGVVLAEWAGRQAVWFSQNLQPEQRLLVRLHGFEASAEWIDQLDLERVEKVLLVSEFYREQVAQKLGWDEQKLAVIPNAVEAMTLARAKRNDARFHLGMLGFVPLLKRPDLAVEVLELLLEKDERFTLHLRGKQPWQHDWIWQRDLYEVDAFSELYQRIGLDERLRQRVVFEPYGANVESWLSGIGWILSLSDRETFHLAAAEGMASGAVPVFMKRNGVTEIFSDRWVFDSPSEIANFIYKTVAEDVWLQESESAQNYATRFDTAFARTLWQEAIFR